MPHDRGDRRPESVRSGAAALAQLRSPGSAPGAMPALAASRTVRLEARSLRWEPAPGRTISAMAYNGQIPGPVIWARDGERLRIALENALTEPTTGALAGVDVPHGKSLRAA